MTSSSKLSKDEMVQLVLMCARPEQLIDKSQKNWPQINPTFEELSTD
jgi:hypothetical protein